MTTPVVKENRKSIDVRFKVVVRYASGETATVDHEVRTYPTIDDILFVYNGRVEAAIEMAKLHIQKKLINFVRFA
jgi:hypothetical protein